MTLLLALIPFLTFSTVLMAQEAVGVPPGVSWQQVTLALIAAIPPTLVALGALIVSLRNSAKLVVVQTATDGMKDALVAAAGEAGRAEGAAQEAARPAAQALEDKALATAGALRRTAGDVAGALEETARQPALTLEALAAAVAKTLATKKSKRK